MTSLTLTPLTPGMLGLTAPYPLSAINVYNVKDYGARCDNGGVAGAGTDDTGAVQATLTAARVAGGGIVWVPAFCRTTADLIIGSNTILAGPGRGVAGIVRDSTTATVAVIRNFDQSVTSADTDIAVRDLTVNRAGAATVANTPFDNAIQMYGVTRATVRGCRTVGAAKGIHFYECRGFDATGNYHDLYADNAIAANANTNVNGYNGIVAQNEAGPCAASGYTVGSSAFLSTQAGVTFHGNVGRDLGGALVEIGSGADRNGIVGNVGIWSGAVTANLANSILAHDVNDVLIDANNLDNGSINVSITGAPRFSRATVTNNKIKGTASQNRAIAVVSIDTATVAGNTVYRGTVGITGCTGTDVSGNSVSYSSVYGFRVDTSSSFVRLTNNRSFNNNQLAGVGDSNSGFVVDGCDTVDLVGNRAYDTAGAGGTQAYGLYINATTNYVDAGNDFNGNKTAARATFTSAPTQRATLGGINIGIGSPEAAVTGPIGAVYQRSDGDARTSLYVKVSGTGNTGWQTTASRLSQLYAALGYTDATFDPGTNASSDLPVSQTTYASAMFFRKGETVTNLVVALQQAASGSTPTTVKLGIYDSGGVCKVVTANLAADSSWLSTGVKSFALTAPWTVPSDGLYYVVVLQNGAWGVAGFRLVRGSVLVNTGLGASPARYGTFGTANTDLPNVGSTAPAFAVGQPCFWFGWN